MGPVVEGHGQCAMNPKSCLDMLIYLTMGRSMWWLVCIKSLIHMTSTLVLDMVACCSSQVIGAILFVGCLILQAPGILEKLQDNVRKGVKTFTVHPILNGFILLFSKPKSVLDCMVHDFSV